MAPFLRLGGDTGDSAGGGWLATATGSDWRFGWHPFRAPFPAGYAVAVDSSGEPYLVGEVWIVDTDADAYLIKFDF